MSRLTQYIRDTRGELKHVSWPTRKQAFLYTVVVILISFGVAVYLGIFDYIFSEVLKLLVS